MNFFSIQPPDQQQVNEKYSNVQHHIAIMLRIIDGVGDIIHLIEFMKMFKQHDPKTPIVVYVSVAPNNIKAYLKVMNYISLAFQEKLINQCYIVRAPVLADKELEAQSRAEISEDFRQQSKLESFTQIIQYCRGVIMISTNIQSLYCPYYSLSWYSQHFKDKKIPAVYIPEYGITRARKEDVASILLGYGPNNYGTRLIDSWLETSEVDQAQALMNISHKPLLRRLLRIESDKEITLPMVREYLQKVHFIPGFVHTEMDAVRFVMITLMAYKYRSDSDHKFDFYLPDSIVSNNTFQQVLREIFGTHFGDTRKLVYLNNDAKEEGEAPVRLIGSYKELSDWEYKSLFRVTKDIAAYAGDDTQSTVFSALALPYPANLYKHESKAQLLYDLIQVITKHLGPSTKLAEYFALFIAKQEFEFSSRMSARYPGYKPVNVNTPFIFTPTMPGQMHDFELEDLSGDFDRESYCRPVKEYLIEVQIEIVNTNINRIAPFLSENLTVLQAEWLKLRQILFAHYNLHRNFPELLRDVENQLTAFPSQINPLTNP